MLNIFLITTIRTRTVVRQRYRHLCVSWRGFRKSSVMMQKKGIQTAVPLTANSCERLRKRKWLKVKKWADNQGKGVFLFEAPIDMLSYITMNPNGWQQNTYAASCSVADRVLFQCLKDNPNLTDVYLCFDSDTAGQSAAKRISDKLFAQGYKSEILVPTKKDWNEDLIMQKEGR